MADTATLILQQSINGVYLGCLYVMVALGLTLIYGVMNQINFAHADFVTVGAFTAFFAVTRVATKVFGLPDTVAYLLSIVLALGAGACEYALVIRTGHHPAGVRYRQISSNRAPGALNNCAKEAATPCTIMIVSPSGSARLTRSSAVSPPAPGMFSTTTLAPSVFARYGWISRA